MWLELELTLQISDELILVLNLGKTLRILDEFHCVIDKFAFGGKMNRLDLNHIHFVLQNGFGLKQLLNLLARVLKGF
jgi:hypothetical protein